MKAVYSYWEDFETKTNGGFRNAREMALVLTLSVLESKKQFSSVEFYTTEYGKKIVDTYKIPFDKVHVVLDELTHKFQLNPQFWAYAKIYVYSLQTEPFIHIDNDVIIWDKIPDYISKSPIFFQNKELLSIHKGYQPILDYALKNLPESSIGLIEILTIKVDWAYNCGVVGGSDYKLFQEWRSVVDSYLFSFDNQEYWSKVPDRHSQNHLFEQYFISLLIRLRGIPAQTLLKDDFMRSAVRDFKYTHLWGEVKRDVNIISKVRDRLYKDYPSVIELFERELSDEEVFTDIYKNEMWGKGQGSGGGSSVEITEEYRKFLENFMKEKKVKSVVDFGSGDWQFSKLINWKGIEYIGIDCVESLVDKCNQAFQSKNVSFLFGDSLKVLENKKTKKFDLLILKDVIIHWNNDKILSFFKTLKEEGKFKYVLVTVQSTENDLVNKDIKVGEFHNLDLLKEPFEFDCEIIFKWPSDNKTTYLFSYI